jgi:hypothetical protein
MTKKFRRISMNESKGYLREKEFELRKEEYQIIINDLNKKVKDK